MSRSIEHDIFPELSPRAELFEKVGLIEKSWLDQADLGFPNHFVALLEKLTLFHILGGQVWYEQQEERLHSQGFGPGMLPALFNLNSSLIYMILCSDQRIRIMTGIVRGPSPHQDASHLSALLESSQGPALFEQQPVGDLESILRSNTCCTALTGLPTGETVKKRNESVYEKRGQGIDVLLSGLIHQEWLYVVQAFPVRRQQIQAWHESCACEIKDIKEAFLLRDTQKSNRMASIYVQVLEKTLKRLQKGSRLGMWQTGVFLFSPSLETVTQGAALMSAVHARGRSQPEPIRTHICSLDGTVSPFINCYTSEDLNRFIDLPKVEYPGFSQRERVPFDLDFHAPQEHAVSIGRIMDQKGLFKHQASVAAGDLTKHGLVAGVTGSGKTNTIFNLLQELQDSYQIPFMVIEPAKAEYRNLLPSVKNMLAFTLGDERPGMSAPFRLNPFAFPQGISLQTHLDLLKAVFEAAFVLYAPMPYVLEECLYRIYEDKGWALVTSTNPRGWSAHAFPTLSDLYKKIDQVVGGIGYDDRLTMDIKSALKTRIKSLCLGGKGRMLNTVASIPMDVIMSRPTVLELKAMGNDEEKAFMMGLILIAIWEHYESDPVLLSDCISGLRHLTVIEEAHRLLKNVPTEKASVDMANTKGQSVETFTNLLAEIRTCGEGIIVAEQIPSKLAPDVLKNTNLKVMHRIVSKEDRDFMGDAMNLNERQKRHVSSLDAGEAVFFSEGLDRAIKIKAPLSSRKEMPVTVENFHGLMLQRFFGDHPQFLRKSLLCPICGRKGAQCQAMNQRMQEISSDPDYEIDGAKLFLPFVFGPVPENVDEYFKAKSSEMFAEMPCFLSHHLKTYIKGQENFFKWPFRLTENLLKTAESIKKIEDFVKLIERLKQWRTSLEKPPFVICGQFCRCKCLTGFEVSMLARDPVTHNDILDLFDHAEFGPRFYIDLLILLSDFFRNHIKLSDRDSLRDVALCYLVQKFNELKLSYSLQRKILEEFIHYHEYGQNGKR